MLLWPLVTLLYFQLFLAAWVAWSSYLNVEAKAED